MGQQTSNHLKVKRIISSHLHQYSTKEKINKIIFHHKSTKIQLHQGKNYNKAWQKNQLQTKKTIIKLEEELNINKIKYQRNQTSEKTHHYSSSI